MICGISESEIIDNMTAEEKFEIVCKIKKINYQEIIGGLINRIKESDIADKDVYISTRETWDSDYFNIIKEEDILFTLDELLWSKEQAIEFFKKDLSNNWKLKQLWIETTEEEKEIIKIAKECKTYIYVEMM